VGGRAVAKARLRQEFLVRRRLAKLDDRRLTELVEQTFKVLEIARRKLVETDVGRGRSLDLMRLKMMSGRPVIIVYNPVVHASYTPIAINNRARTTTET